MTITLILVTFAVLALAFFLFWVRRGAVLRGDESDISHRLVAVNLAAFRNLVDETEEQFLRANLPSKEYRGIHRARARASLDYVSGVFSNAGILLQFGQLARRSADPEIAEAGRRLVDSAARLRLFAVLAGGKLIIGMLFPDANLGTMGIADSYHQTREWAAVIGRLQDPGKRALISSTS